MLHHVRLSVDPRLLLLLFYFMHLITHAIINGLRMLHLETQMKECMTLIVRLQALTRPSITQT